MTKCSPDILGLGSEEVAAIYKSFLGENLPVGTFPVSSIPPTDAKGDIASPLYMLESVTQPRNRTWVHSGLCCRRGWEAEVKVR